MENNRAAWLMAAKASPLVVGPGPKPMPLADEVVIRVAYAAINPIDWKVQDYDIMINAFPNILGGDVAGVIVQVGSGVTRLKVGQRVIGHCSNLYTQKPTDAAFQNFATVKDILTAPIPDKLPFANAAVLPIGFSSAASGLFVKSAMALPFPSVAPKETGKAVLIWGGSSSVGANAVQLAKAAGMTVITTASAKNHDFVEALGADQVFDHASTAVVDDIIMRLQNTQFAGAFDAVGVESSCRACAKIVSQLGGGVLTTVLVPLPEGLPENVKASFSTCKSLLKYCPSLTVCSQSLRYSQPSKSHTLAKRFGRITCLPHLHMANSRPNLIRTSSRAV